MDTIFYCLLINGDELEALNGEYINGVLINGDAASRLMVLFFESFFYSNDTCRKHAHYFFCICVQAIKHWFIYIICFFQ